MTFQEAQDLATRMVMTEYRAWAWEQALDLIEAGHDQDAALSALRAYSDAVVAIAVPAIVRITRRLLAPQAPATLQ